MPLKFKIHWKLNWIVCAIVFVILAIILAYRYFTVGVPVEANWTEEIFKYLFMWIPITVIGWVICYAPFRALSSYLAKKKGANDETSGGD
jgi:prolipoprotein diacylglyceryltransferase